MKEKINQDIKTLWQLYDNFQKFRNEIKSEIKNYVQENRTFFEGDEVRVMEGLTNTELGIGIVGKASVIVTLDDGLEIKTYNDDEQKLDYDLNCILYQVFARKKDGTRSINHFFQAPHFLPDKRIKYTDYYISKY